MKQFMIAFTLFLMLVFGAAQAATAGQAKTTATDLMIHIIGFENTSGVAKVALLNSRENWESDGNPYMGFNFKIIDNEVIQTITVPRGEYAVKVFHDANGNDELDTLLFGIPAERYGFSNNAKGAFGPPTYDDAKFQVKTAEHKLSITVQ